MLDKCSFCNQEFDSKDLIEGRNEKMVCEDCAMDRCSSCSTGECEVETPSGDYLCVDCYSGMIDRAMDCYD